jgi:hypothetical protein
LADDAASLKPSFSAVTRYVLTGSSGTEYAPRSSVVASRLRPVSVLVILIFAPDTRAPLASVTVPVI